MKRTTFSLIFTFVVLSLFAQEEKKPIDNSPRQQVMPVPFRLYPTQNIWTFIKLDTRNGKMWQVQFGMKSEGRFETILNVDVLINKDKEENDRFTLYPTQNIYTFILLDQIEGKTWQVQWSTDKEKRGVIPIQ